MQFLYIVAKDILFLLDTSESIGEFVFNGQMIPIVQNFIQNPDLVFDDQNTQVGLLASSNGQHLDIPLKNYQTKEELIKSLKVSLSLSLSENSRIYKCQH